MWLLGALVALFVSGFWLYCLVDVALTPRDECGPLPKTAWIIIVAGTFVIGAVAWLAVRRPAQPTPAPLLPGTSGADPDRNPGTRPGQRDGGRPGNERTRPGGAPGPGGVARRELPGSPGSATPGGPDDDPEFLRSLDRAIHGADTGDDPNG